jgi:ATP-binding cassette subfamily A (ABC1) protein 3
MEARNLKPEDYEPVAPEIARQELDDQYLSIQDLKKTYDNGFEAVKGLSMKMYNG